MEKEVGLQPLYEYGGAEILLNEEESSDFLMLLPDLFSKDAPWSAEDLKLEELLREPPMSSWAPQTIDLGISPPESAELGDTMSPGERKEAEQLLEENYFADRGVVEDREFRKNIGLLLLLDSTENGTPLSDAEPFLGDNYLQEEPLPLRDFQEDEQESIIPPVAKEQPAEDTQSDGATGGQFLEDLDPQELAELREGQAAGCKITTPPQLFALSNEPARVAQLELHKKIEQVARKNPIADGTKDVVRSFPESLVPKQRHLFLETELQKYSEQKTVCRAEEISEAAASQEESANEAFDKKTKEIETRYAQQADQAAEQEAEELEKAWQNNEAAIRQAEQKFEQALTTIEQQKGDQDDLLQALESAHEKDLARLETEALRTESRIEEKWQTALDTLERKAAAETEAAEQKFEQQITSIEATAERLVAASETNINEETNRLQAEAKEILQEETKIIDETADQSLEEIERSQLQEGRTTQIGKSRPWTAEAARKAARWPTVGGAIASNAIDDIRYYKAKEKGENNPKYTKGSKRGDFPKYNLCRYGGLCNGTGPWCMAFGRYIWMKTGVRGAPRFAVEELYKWGSRKDLLESRPRKGSFALFNKPGAPGSDWTHVGIVVSTKGPGVTLAEGNTSLKNGGDGASLKRRSSREITVYVHRPRQ